MKDPGRLTKRYANIESARIAALAYSAKQKCPVAIKYDAGTWNNDPYYFLNLDITRKYQTIEIIQYQPEEKELLFYYEAKLKAIELSKQYGTDTFIMQNGEGNLDSLKQYYACLPEKARSIKDVPVLQVGPTNYKVPILDGRTVTIERIEEKTPGIPEILTAIEKLTAEVNKKHYATIKIAPDELVQRAYDAIVLLLENEDLSPEAELLINWDLIRQVEKHLLPVLRELKK